MDSGVLKLFREPVIRQRRFSGGGGLINRKDGKSSDSYGKVLVKKTGNCNHTVVRIFICFDESRS